MHVKTQSSDKVDISRIFIHPTDGSASTARVSSIEAANTVLQGWAHQQSGAAAGECEVQIVFEDGIRYRSHYHLREQESGISLGRHVRRQLATMAKAGDTRKEQLPANDALICPDERDPAECAKEILAHYNI